MTSPNSLDAENKTIVLDLVIQLSPWLGRSDQFAAPSDNMGRQGSGFSRRNLLSRNIPVLV